MQFFGGEERTLLYVQMLFRKRIIVLEHLERNGGGDREKGKGTGTRFNFTGSKSVILSVKLPPFKIFAF